MLKKIGVMTIGVAAGLVAAAPLASAQEAPAAASEAGDAQTSSNSPAVQAPVEEGALAGILDQSNTDLGSNGQSLSGNGTFVNGHDLSS